MLKLHLGCGPHILKGWENVDLEPAIGGVSRDLRKPFPYPRSSVQFIFTEHFLEHLTRLEAVRFMQECYRVLTPTGVLRISTPNLSTLIADYRKNKIDRWAAVWKPKNACQMLNDGLRFWGHQHVYDSQDLELLIQESGFSIVSYVSYGHSEHPELKSLERRPFHDDLIVEIEK